MTRSEPPSIYRPPPPAPRLEVWWGDAGAPRLRVDGRSLEPGSDGLAVWHLGALDDTDDARERIVAVWRRAGVEGLGTLRGAFVAILVDSRQGRVVAARDPLGLVPLFHGTVGHRLWLSPDLSRLTGPGAPAGLDRGLDRVVLAELLLDVASDVEETVYRGVRRLPGGCARVWSEAGPGKLVRIWDPLPSRDPIPWHPGPVDRLCEELEDRLGAVVTRHLRRADPDRVQPVEAVGVFLSSGIDSVSLAALASRRTAPGERLPLALSLRFDHPSVDESSAQRHVATQLGLDQLLLTVDEALAEPSGRGPLAAALTLAEGWPQPLLNLWLPAYGGLARHARQRGVTALWTGTGGDEWLSVSPLWAAELWRRGRVDELVRMFRAFARSQRLPTMRLAGNLIWQFGLRPILAAPVRRRLGAWAPGFLRRRGSRRVDTLAPPWLIADPALRQALRERLATPAPVAQPLTPVGEYLGELRRGLYHPISAMEVEETWEAGRRVGLPWLHPLLDADLVGWLARLHPRDLLTGGWSKGLARDFLRCSFPELGVDRLPKPHVTEAFRRRILREGPDRLAELRPFPALETLGLVSGERAARALERILSSASASDPRSLYRFWQILHFESWLRGRIGVGHNGS